MIPFLLQTNFNMPEANSSTTIIFIAALAGFVLLLIIGSKRSSANAGKSGSTKKVSKGGFRRKAQSLGLNKQQITTLYHLGKQHSEQNPMNLLSNASRLDSVLQDKMEEIDATVIDESVKEARKLYLYRIKQQIERNSKRKESYGSSKRIPMGQKLIIKLETGVRYESKVIANMKNALGVAVPQDNEEQQVRWKKWTSVQVNFWRRNGQGFSFDSKVLGYSSVKTQNTLLIQHVGNVKQVQQRQYRRKSMDQPAYFYQVQVMTIGTGRNTKKKAVINHASRSLGTVLDVSSGGCSMRGSHPLPQGQLVKMDFDTGAETPVSVFGKVVSVDKEQPYGGIMHIQFNRISKENMNKINSFVYNYANPE